MRLRKDSFTKTFREELSLRAVSSDQKELLVTVNPFAVGKLRSRYTKITARGSEQTQKVRWGL